MDPGSAVKGRAQESSRRKAKPGWLVWSAAVAEAVLVAAAAVVLSKYWLMLPVWMRNTAAGGLALMGALLVLRVLLFYRNRR